MPDTEREPMLEDVWRMYATAALTGYLAAGTTADPKDVSQQVASIADAMYYEEKKGRKLVDPEKRLRFSGV